MANRAGYNPDDKVSKSSKGHDVAIAGLISGVVTRSIVQPLDVFKVRYQLQIEAKTEAKYQSFRQMFKTILKEEGITAFWKGHLPAQYLSAVFMTSQFYGVDLFTRSVHTNFPSLKDSPSKRTFVISLGGGFGASMATIVSFPFDVLRTRFIAQPSINSKDSSGLYYKNTTNALSQIIQREGIFGLYKGILPQLLSMGPTSALIFASYSSFTELYYALKKDQLNPLEKFLLGSMSGVVGKTVMYPLDTIRKRLQIQGFEEGRKGLGETTKYSNMRQCIVTMYKQEHGLRAFYKGYGPGMAKAFVSTGFYLSLFEFFKLLLVKNRSLE